MYQYNPLLEMSFDRYKKAIKSFQTSLKNQGKTPEEIQQIISSRLRKGTELSHKRMPNISHRVRQLASSGNHNDAQRVAKRYVNAINNVDIRDTARAVI